MNAMEKTVQKIGPKFHPTFAHGTCGPSAYAEAAHKLVNTFDPVEFVVSIHPLADIDPEKVVNIYRFQRCEWDDRGDGPHRIRWCGESGDPLGAGSHSLHCYDVNSPAEVAAALAESLTGLAHKVKGGIVTMI